MQAFTIRNAVVLSLAQVMTVVMGILAGGVSYKLLKMGASPGTLPGSLMFVRNFGVILLLVPLVWISVAAWVRVSRKVTDAVRDSVFYSGFLCLAALLLFLGWAAVSPWFSNGRAPLGPTPTERVSE